ncbi:MAG: hypothetical protein Q7S10_01935 [bacterium]|nr:hypothetical protein [bacterium]
MNKKIFFIIMLVVPLLYPGSLLQAVDYSSSSFILRDPVITASGGRSTASSFTFFSSTGQIAPGESTSGSFKYKAGFLYFDETAVVVTPEVAGSASVSGGSASVGLRVVFSGKAYPGATVVLLKDAQIAATVTANQNADFTIEAGRLSAADYIFSLYAKDSTGKSSRLIVIPVAAGGGTTTINNILIPPTISGAKKQVAKGEPLDIFGQSIPNASILIAIKKPTGEFSVNTVSDAGGNYRHALDTSLLGFGEYQATAEASFGNIASISSAIRFIVGDETILEDPSACPLKGDLNEDCAVNLIDFSILIYWFDFTTVPEKVDLNGDKKADLVDFSVMAYYWTG